MRLSVSFVIPVRNDAARLERCVRSILQNTEPGPLPEVVVIDNGSTDESGARARALGAKVLRIDGGNVAELRNAGAASASGDVLAFVDADHEIGNQWVTTAALALRQADVAAVGALCHAPKAGTWVQRAYGVLRGVPVGRHDVEWLGSGNVAIRRDVFLSVAGFDTTLTTCEDVDLCNRIRAAGHRIVSDAQMINVHFGDPATLRELFKGELWRGRDNLRVTLRGPITLRALPSAIIPVVDLLAIGVAAIGLVLAVINGRGWLLAAVAALVIGAGAALRAGRALAHSANARPVTVLQVGAAALVFDVARACALVARAPHRTATVQAAVAQ